MSKRIILFLCLLVSTAVSTASANTKQVHFVGVHPLPKSEGGGICYIEGPHVHIFGADKLQYRDHGGANYFVGDPVAYGFDGPKYAYKGHHPIHVDAVLEDGAPDEEWCYIDGPHFHPFAPPASPEFTLTGGAYFYVGTPPPVYVEARPAMVKINAIYTPLVYDRPVVDVAVVAPDGWIGVRYPAVVVEAPHVDIVAPHIDVVAPSVHIGVGIGVGVGVGVGVIGGGGVMVKGGHHDNGWHKGGRHK